VQGHVENASKAKRAARGSSIILAVLPARQWSRSAAATLRLFQRRSRFLQMRPRHRRDDKLRDPHAANDLEGMRAEIDQQRMQFPR